MYVSVRSVRAAQSSTLLGITSHLQALLLLLLLVLFLHTNTLTLILISIY